MRKELELTGVDRLYANLVDSIYRTDIANAEAKAKQHVGVLMRNLVEAKGLGNNPTWSIDPRPDGALVLSWEVPDIAPPVQPDANAG